jgi:hypothetical protein
MLSNPPKHLSAVITNQISRFQYPQVSVLLSCTFISKLGSISFQVYCLLYQQALEAYSTATGYVYVFSTPALVDCRQEG